jgi:hypothetical protein
MPLAVVACRAAELGQAIPHFKDSFAATAAVHFRGWPPVSKIVSARSYSTFLHWFLIFRRFLRLAQRGPREMQAAARSVGLHVRSPHDGCDKKRRVSHENGYNIIGGG